jgi:hypothetical protein
MVFSGVDLERESLLQNNNQGKESKMERTSRIQKCVALGRY